MKKKILIQVNCSYEFYIYFSLINNNFESYEISLLAPHNLLIKIDKFFLNKFRKIYGYNHKLKNLFSLVAIKSSIKLSIWCYLNKNNFAIFLGVYRNEVSSIIAKHFFRKAKLITIKQGIDIKSNRYKDFKNLSTLHDFFISKFWFFIIFKIKIKTFM